MISKIPFMDHLSLPMLSCGALILLLGWIVYARLLHPAAKVPGPFLASITRLWYVLKVRDGAFDHVNRDLHQKYGLL